ncbi:MAG: hypothetical protein HKP24_09490 [Croceitalea sp.]|nr:hypothetical protein [Croceitalea sp.]NNM18783.1 hypothetical protein [Croceitalea sp.]
MHKLLVCAGLSLLIFGCKNQGETLVTDDTESVFFSFHTMPKKQSLNTKANEALANWVEFKALESSFNVMLKAQNNEDLVLAINDLLEKEVALSKSTYPKIYDVAQIKSRQRVLRTFLLKVKASLQERTDVEVPMKQMLEANNALRKQFNVIVNNDLNTKLILDE